MDTMTAEEARTRNPRLYELITIAAGHAARTFDGDHDSVTASLVPVWCGETPSGEKIVVATPFDSPDTKIIASAAVRLLFEQRDVIRYVFTSESWIREADPDEELDYRTDGQVSKHPDRIEVIAHNAEDVTGNSMVAVQPIIRTRRKARVGPLKFVNMVGLHGRLTGVLKPRQL